MVFYEIYMQKLDFFYRAKNMVFFNCCEFYNIDGFDCYSLFEFLVSLMFLLNIHGKLAFLNDQN